MDGKGEAPLERGSDSVAFANQARELVVLRDVVVDAATVGAGLWFSYVFVLLYLFIAVAGVTHRNLFFEDPVKLPFLNVDLPIVSFFLFGPVLFLIVHTYVLIHLVLFAGKVGIFHSELRAQVTDPKTRAQLRWQLPSNLFVQAIAGAREVRTGATGRLMWVIALISLVVAPVALLVSFQIQFLPYHPRPLIASWLRVSVVVDIVLLWILWPSIARGRLTAITRRDVNRAKTLPRVRDPAQAVVFPTQEIE